MKFLVKVTFFVFAVIISAYNLALFFVTYLLLVSAKISGLFWWPREVFLVSPFLFLLVLGMSYFGFALGISVMLNFKGKNGSTSKNVGKYLLSFFLAIGGALCLLYEIGRIGHGFLGVWEMGRIEFISGLKLRKIALLVPLVVAGAYGVFFAQEKHLNITVLRGKSRLNKFLLVSIPAIWFFIGLFWTIGYFQHDFVNPGFGKVDKSANFTVYGLKNSERYYWIGEMGYDEKTQEVWGKIAPKNNSHLPLLIKQKRNSGENVEKILNYARKKSLNVKEYHFEKTLFRGYEEIKSDGSSQKGEFVWQFDQQTDMIIAGTIPVYLNWQRVLGELASSFERQ